MTNAQQSLHPIEVVRLPGEVRESLPAALREKRRVYPKDLVTIFEVAQRLGKRDPANKLPGSALRERTGLRRAYPFTLSQAACAREARGFRARTALSARVHLGRSERVGPAEAGTLAKR